MQFLGKRWIFGGKRWIVLEKDLFFLLFLHLFCWIVWGNSKQNRGEPGLLIIQTYQWCQRTIQVSDLMGFFLLSLFLCFVCATQPHTPVWPRRNTTIRWRCWRVTGAHMLTLFRPQCRPPEQAATPCIWSISRLWKVRVHCFSPFTVRLLSKVALLNFTSDPSLIRA